jgi:hypothetical protein
MSASDGVHRQIEKKKIQTKYFTPFALVENTQASNDPVDDNGIITSVISDTAQL